MNTASFRRWLPASATFDPSLVTEKFFKAAIEFPITKEPEASGEPDPEG